MLHTNIGELMSHRAYVTPKDEGYIGRKRYSFAHMNERVNQFANYLTAKNIKPGDRMAVLCKNHEDFITAFFGAAKIGIITVPINWRLHVKEMEYIISNCEPSLLLYDGAFTETIEELQHTITIPMLQAGNESFDEILKDYVTDEPELISKDNDTILIMYTSGTTGKPKGAMITHSNLLAASIGMSHVIDWWYGDRFLSVAPFFHIGGFAPIITNLHNGSTSVLMADFDPVAVWKIIEEEKITTMMTVPAMLQFMLKVIGKTKNDFSSLRNITCGASVVPEQLIQAYGNLGISVQQVYGITEYTGAVSFWKKLMDESKMNSMGKVVFHGHVKVVNPLTKEELPANEIGEIICSGPQVFKGYWNNPTETDSILNDGNYRTGDLGRIDEDGFLYVKDRLKDMIISGGENIYSSELESVINTHPDVTDVAVVGKRDSKWGEIPKAYVVKNEGATITEESIIKMCHDNLAAYKCVKEVEFIKQLPRNAAGKVLKHVLKSRDVTV
ncbi:class I adenylate-forming enzyme family protein [Pseudogracilibacillus auburnensis]|uniref:O-succinylbenzoate-CoA ligase n=1 Tax=Pseudogracilibacillus auburnensis TaxID=1494959 RepID=A0A2V3VR41_9BACI|nr:long-chain-fatty-acid--CoA ligase [Pseudogracilibacillus auburnensis]PXW83614.1 O-succinylbenzoate-CoA ligase [Pseudogracilibacillus auburnensis]